MAKERMSKLQKITIQILKEMDIEQRKQCPDREMAGWFTFHNKKYPYYFSCDLDSNKELHEKYPGCNFYRRKNIKKLVKQRLMEYYELTEDNKLKWKENPKYNYFFKRQKSVPSDYGVTAFDVSFTRSLYNLIKKDYIKNTYTNLCHINNIAFNVNIEDG